MTPHDIFMFAPIVILAALLLCPLYYLFKYVADQIGVKQLIAILIFSTLYSIWLITAIEYFAERASL